MKRKISTKGHKIELEKKVSKKLKLNDMDDAIVEGVVKFNKGDELMLRRDHVNDNKICSCTVMDVNEKTVSLYDNTMQQWFIFNIDQYQQITLKNYINYENKISTIH